MWKPPLIKVGRSIVWKHDKLVEKIDVYLANHWSDKPLSGTIGKTSAPTASKVDMKVTHINPS